MPFDLDPSYVSATAAKLGLSLPVEYAASMSRMNGGCAEIECEVWWLHPIFDDTDPRRLKRTVNDVIRETREASGWASRSGSHRGKIRPSTLGTSIDPGPIGLRDW